MIALALAGCGSKKEASTQVAARINSNEITIHQVNNILSKTPALASKDITQARRNVLEQLIDQQLAIDQAVDRKLDRSPEVVNAIEAAKRQILAQAYLQQAISALPKPSAREIKQYFDEHPELFVQRQVYELHAIELQPTADIKASLETMVAQGKSLDEIGSFLQAQDIPFNEETVTRPADQLPLEALPKLVGTKPGGRVTIETPSGFQVVSVVGAKPAPMDFASASPRIEQFMFNQRAGEFVKKDLQRLRKLAAIEYVGESFAQSGLTQPVRNSSAITTIADNLPETPSATGSIELGATSRK